MKRPAPNLTDPAERAAYRRELMAVAKGWRLSGVAVALLGAALILANAYLLPIPNLIVWPVIVFGFVLRGIGLSVRNRYHRQRLRGAI